ncbi:MAG: amino acid ABC transporter permease [Deltaproteobacteria bacterium]|jgi:polar amino acid transport system permease protein|nr:amino acid ABC transporter permease [Deltaproteobacteria bacterium]
MPDFFDLATVQSALYILRGTGYTIILIVGAMICGLIIGLPLAAIEVFGPRWAKALAAIYVWFFRGIPILVLLFLFYFGVFGWLESILAKILGHPVNFPPLVASVTALGLVSGAYQSQIFRGTILSLHHGQFLAAKSLGFSTVGVIIHVILPQALRLAIPAWSNEYSIILKDSAIAYVLGTVEIMARIGHMVSMTHRHIPFYLLAGLLYFLLTHLGVTALRAVERRTRIQGLGHEAQVAEKP